MWDSQKSFMKSPDDANNFKKDSAIIFVKSTKNLVKFVDWKVRFKCLKVLLYLSVTCSNILIGKHKWFVNNFLAL